MRRTVLAVMFTLLAAPLFAADPPVEEGFVSLFNGTDLTGWQGAVNGYLVENGAIVCDPQKGGNLFTAKEYGNFVLRFEFKLPVNANNGLGIRSPLQGDPAYVGMELQILDNSGSAYTQLKPYQYHGSIYGVVPAKKNFQKPTGEWNTQEVVADGDHIKVILNGEVIVDADLSQIGEETMDGRGRAGHPGLARKTGYIGFLGHGSRVEFRNIRIKEL